MAYSDFKTIKDVKAKFPKQFRQQDPFSQRWRKSSQVNCYAKIWQKIFQ